MWCDNAEHLIASYPRSLKDVDKGALGSTSLRGLTPNDSTVECLIFYKLIPLTVGRIIFPGELIKFDLSDFDIIFGMN